MEFRKKRIVIADDSHTFLMYMGILLKRMGFNVIPAENGLEVLKLLRLMEPDVVILDVIMEMMDGVTLLKYIKEDKQTSHIPVIMVSIDSSSERIEKCKKLGCAGYLLKPIKIGKLHEILQECIFSPLGRNRKHLRAAFHEKVSITCGGIPSNLYAETLSEGGIYIRKKDPFPVGSEVEVTLPLKSGEPIHLKGVVVYIKGLFGDMFKIPPGMAIEFKEMTNNEAKILKNYVEQLMAQDIFESQEETVIEPDEKGKAS